MRIVDLEAIPVRARLAGAFATSKSSPSSDRGITRILVKLYTDSDIVGLGECAPAAAWNHQTPETTLAALCYSLRPAIVGQSPLAIEEIHRRMSAVLPEGSHQPARTAIDLACFDAAGKHLGRPVYELLGAARRERLDVLWGLGMPEPDVAAAIARQKESDGYRLIKVKVGADPRADVARVTAVRQALGASTLVTIDANEGYTRGEAAQVCAALRQHDVFCFEQPIARRDLAGLAWLRATGGLPIMLDESVMSAADLLRAVSHDAADYLFLKLDNVGGIHPARTVAAIARAANVVPIPGGSLNLGVGAAALAHLAMALNLDLPGGFNGPLLLEHPLTAAGGLVYEAGGSVLRVPAGPGLGVELDEAALREYRVPQPR